MTLCPGQSAYRFRTALPARSLPLPCPGFEEGNFHVYYLVLHHPVLRASGVTSAAPRHFSMLRSHASRAEGLGRNATELNSLVEALGASGLGLSSKEQVGMGAGMGLGMGLGIALRMGRGMG